MPRGLQHIDLKLWRRKYHGHRANAVKVGKVFDMTFDEWLQIWVESGRMLQRGNRKGQYVMARYGDKGSYAVGNVKIITVSENIAERVFSDKMLETLRAVHIGAKRSAKTKAKMRSAWKRRRPRLVSDETRLKKSKSMLATWAKHRAEGKSWGML